MLTGLLKKFFHSRWFWPLTGIGFFCLFLLASYFFSLPKQTFLSPWGGEIFQKITGRKTQVVGFLPYWNVTPELTINFPALDQLIYFGLTVGEDGSLQTVQDGETEPGWQRLSSGSAQNILAEAKRKRKKILLSIISFDADVTDAVISDPEKRQRLINELITVVKDYDFDGVDIDFEYFPEDDNLKDFGTQFNQFLKELKTALRKEKTGGILSVDIYPKAFIYTWPYQLPELGKIADQIIIMAYDYTQSNADQAGPVAPIKTQDEKEMSIVQTMKAALSQIDKSRLVLGIPLYGYEWRVTSEAPRSPTYWGGGEMASYNRVKELIREKNLTVNWDEVAYSPWLTYKDGWQIKQIYFENLKSLNAKIELAQQLDLQGIAFWALGYEGNHQEIWDLLKKKL